MKIVFTVCSNNYLAQAKTLGDSIKQTNPDYQFYIGLTDKLSTEIDYSKEITYPIIFSSEIGIPDFDNLWKKYSIVEFNTSVRPFYYQFFINQFKDIEFIFYFDPDMLVYGNLSTIEQEFGVNGRILLTPHILTPIDLDDRMPNENMFLVYGIYNLGFLGLKFPQQSNKFLEWWKERAYHLCYIQPSKGLFVDQLWFNLSPLFFDNVIISKHPGLNMAPWNLHERSLSELNEVFYKGITFPFIFYHFSDFKYTDSDINCGYYTRFSIETRKDLKRIYHQYRDLLVQNGIQKIEKITCFYIEMREKYINDEKLKNLRSSPKNMFSYYLNKFLPQKAIKILHAIIS